MYLPTIGRHFSQMIAYFLVMNSKRCIICSNGTRFPPQYSCIPDDKKVMEYGESLGAFIKGQDLYIYDLVK